MTDNKFLTVDELIEKLNQYKNDGGTGEDLICINVFGNTAVTVQSTEFRTTKVNMSNMPLSEAIRSGNIAELDKIMNRKNGVCIN